MTEPAKPEKVTIEGWLADLHMECYKKQLEDFDTIKQLLELKDTEQKLKKLGVVNCKDRTMMMSSINSFRKNSAAKSSPVISALQQDKLTRKGSTKKLKLKNLLSSGSSKKSKKKTDNFSTPVPSTVQVTEIQSPPGSPVPLPKYKTPLSPLSDDYEDIPELSPRHRARTMDPGPYKNWRSVENEYVPPPEPNQRSDEYRIRSNTMANYDRQVSGISTSSSSFSQPGANGDIQYRNRLDVGRKEDSPGAIMTRHLSGASMESGLSFGYDVEKDFNPSLPLENQPWFRGRISRGEAESLLNDDGDFIVRENTVILNSYTLSLRWRGEFDHTMINSAEVVNNTGDITRATGIKYHFEAGAFDTIPELIFNHLKYQIPISIAQHTLIINPICRPGTTNNSTPGSTHRAITAQQSYQHTLTPTTQSSSFSTLPRNFERKSSVASLPAEDHRAVQTLVRSGGPSVRNYSQLRQANSSGDLLDERPPYGEQRNHRGVISPPPIAEFRSRAQTTAYGSQVPEPVAHVRQESFGDYVAMGSVSICGDSEADLQERARTHTMPTHYQQGSDRSNYAEIMYNRKREPDRRPVIADDAVKYAEVRFTQNTTPTLSRSRNNSPYQSRADMLARRTPVENSPSTQQYARIKFDDSPHPFSQYASVQKNSSSSLSSRESSPRLGDHLYAQPDKLRNLKDRASTASNDSALSTTSSQSSISAAPAHSSRLQHSHAPSAKVHRELPGYDALVKVHTLLQSHSNKHLAYHLTRSDAVSFLLAPRPGEEESVWKDRVNKTTSSSGMYRGLQTLADPDGEKLWKKLYHRHLNLSQTVTLCVITAGDALERAKLLHRFIEIASILQSGKCGNLFSFISIMQGLNVPQITDMTDVWDLLKTNFPNSITAHKDLLATITNLNEGIPMFSADQLTIPAIQHLKTVFHYSEPVLPGFNNSHEDRSLVGEYWSLACGLDGIRNIVSHTSHFSFNARTKLEGRKYDAGLMDFFLSDFTRVYLSAIGVHVDDPQERRRRFGVLMDALVMRVEASESV